MKLRNLMYATMIACAFASCSKDEDPVINPDGGEAAEATFSMKVSNVKTKASSQEINDLSVLIFKGTDGSAVLEKIGKSTNETEVLDIPVTSGNKQVLVLANTGDLTGAPYALVEGTTTYTDVLAKTVAFSHESDGDDYIMNSRTYKLTLAVGKKNCLGYSDSDITGKGADAAAVIGEAGVEVKEPVKLYRNVAKVVLNKTITSTPAAGYTGATFTPEAVLLVHGTSVTALTNATEWGALASSGYTYGNDANVSGETYADWVTRLASFEPVFAPVQGQEAVAAVKAETSYVIAYDGSSQATEPYTFYTFENPSVDVKTLLVVRGTYKYKDVNGADVVENNRYYPIAVGHTGIGQSGIQLPGGWEGTTLALSGRTGNVFGVIRNLQYNISLTVKGPGYDTPFGPKPGDDNGDTFLDVICQVVPFGVIEQSGDIE